MLKVSLKLSSHTLRLFIHATSNRITIELVVGGSCGRRFY